MDARRQAKRIPVPFYQHLSPRPFPISRPSCYTAWTSIHAFPHTRRMPHVSAPQLPPHADCLLSGLHPPGDLRQLRAAVVPHVPGELRHTAGEADPDPLAVLPHPAVRGSGLGQVRGQNRLPRLRRDVGGGIGTGTDRPGLSAGSAARPLPGHPDPGDRVRRRQRPAGGAGESHRGGLPLRQQGGRDEPAALLLLLGLRGRHPGLHRVLRPVRHRALAGSPACGPSCR